MFTQSIRTKAENINILSFLNRDKVHTITTDHKCQELWTLLQKGRDGESNTIHEIVRNRREAERNIASGDHLYRIDWVRCVWVSR